VYVGSNKHIFFPPHFSYYSVFFGDVGRVKYYRLQLFRYAHTLNIQHAVVPL